MVYDAVLNHCPNHRDTDGMSYEEWLELRKGSIGGSDAGAIMKYVGEWGSPLTVFMIKKGIAKAKDMSPAAKRGKKLEPVIRDDAREDYPGLAIERVPCILYHPEHPFMSANLDGVVFAGSPVEVNGKTIEGLGGLEIKTSKTGYGFGADEIPDGHYCQVQHYMAVTGLKWFVMAAYFLENEEIGYYAIERNDDFIRGDLIPAEKAFWENHMLTGEWPAALGIDEEESMLAGLFEGGSSLVLGEEERELCREYAEARSRKKEAEETMDRASTELKARLVQRQSKNGEKKIYAIAGTYSVSWTRFMRHDVDREAMKKAGIYDQYSKVSESGQFRITEKKGA
ncbi:MAG: YqaJ viral recombinase family protein [Treponema sp.]|jgi:putative phage-type endonuclease|nr:YqaJ viral recombinase family protein [Treponema sp.]